MRASFPEAVRRSRRLLRTDGGIVTITFVAHNLIRILSSVTLTRILAPEEFGVIGILTSIAYTVAVVSDVGFAAFVIRHSHADDPKFLDAIWTIRLLRSVLLTVVLAVLAGPISLAIGKPEMRLPIQAFSLIFVLDGLSALTTITALRSRQLVRLNLVQFTSVVVQLAVSIPLAILLRSYWAILFATLIAHLVTTILSYIAFRESSRRFRLHIGYLKELLRFARYITAASILTLLISQTDKLVLSRLLSLETFGLYIIAVSLATIPLMFADKYTEQVLYPRYCQFWQENPASLARAYYSIRRPLGLLYMAGVGGLIGTAPLVIEILYDDRYRGAALYLSILAFGSLMALSNRAGNAALVAIGRPDVTFKTNVARLAWLAVAGTLGWLEFGPLGVIAAFSSVELAATSYQWRALKAAGILSIKEELLLLGSGALGVGVGGLASWALLPFVRLLA